MAGVRIGATASSHDVLAGLGRILSRIEDPTRAFEEIGALFVSSAQHRIQEERDPDGRRWPELAESTQKKRIGKRKLRGKEHMLRLKGHLFRSLTWRADRHGAEAGSVLKYAALQQLGGTPDMENAGAAANPGRPYLGVSDQDEREISKILTDYLDGAVG